MVFPIAVIIVGLILIVSIIWPSKRGAPWVPTPFNKVHKMLRLANVQPGDTVYDLGCGDGRTIIIAARRYGAHAVGIEIDPLRYIWCRFLVFVLGLKGKVEIRFGDFFNQNLGDADVVTCYLLSDTNKRLQKKFHAELSPNVRIVSHAFLFPSLIYIRKDETENLYLYYLQR